MMQKWLYFVTLSRETIRFMGWFWLESVLLVGAAVVLTGITVLRGRSWLPLRRGAWQLVLVLNPAAIIAIGTIWLCENCSRLGGVRHVWAMRAVGGLFYAQLLVAVLTVWRTAMWRPWVVTVQALLLWLTYFAAAISGMSVSGDWP